MRKTMQSHSFHPKNEERTMPANKNALIRYKTIDNCLRNRYRRWTLDDLVALSKASQKPLAYFILPGAPGGVATD